MNRAQRRRNRNRSKSFILGASLATGALVGYVGYSRVLPALASTTCVVNDAGLGAGDSTNKTFRYCITNSNAGDVITFDSSLTRITMESTPFTIDKSLTIDGYSGRASRMIFSGDDSYQIMTVTSGPLTLKDLSFRNGAATDGGAIYARDSSGDVDVIIQGVEAIENQSYSGNGGFLYTDGDVTISSSEDFDSSFTSGGSSGTYKGGAIFAAGNVTVSDATFQNYYASNGGTIYANNVYVNGGEFYNSRAAANGGAIYAKLQVVVTESSGDVRFRHSVAQRYGGAIYAVTVDFQAGTIDYSSVLANYRDAGADKGGGIFAYSSATISGGTFKGLEADRNGGAVYSVGTLTISGSPEFDSNQGGRGGAVYSFGTLTISGSPEFDSNQGDRGGAVYSYGDIQVSGNPDFKNNHANDYGGAIGAYGNVTVGGTASFTGNSSGYFGGAIYAATDGEITINDTPVFTSNTGDSAGGALFAPTVEITGASTFTSNVAGISGGGAVSGQLVTVSGAATFRSNSSKSYGGAISHVGGSELTISGDAKFYNNGNTDANNTSYVTRYGGAVYAAGNVSVSGNIIFSGNSASTDGGAIFSDSHVYISGGGSFTNNDAYDEGGAIYARYLTSTASALSFVGNTATNGGAIYGYLDTSLTGNHTFTNNSATRRGGAVSTRDFSLTSTRGNESVFNNNDASVDGGAIYARRDLSVTYAEFTNSDTTSGKGGAIYAIDAIISNSIFTNNTAGSYGGALGVGGSFDIDDSTFTSNNAYKGGAVYVRQAFDDCFIDNSTFTSNQATDGKGGAIYTESSDLTITSATFDSNSSTLKGGAIYGGGNVTLTDSTFESNISSQDSAGAVYSSGETDVTGSYFYANQANRSGGAISSWSTITVNDSLFYMNTAGSNFVGGGIYAEGKAYVYNTTLYKNSAGVRGSAIFSDGSSGKSVLNFVTAYKNYITNYGNNLDAAVYLGRGYTYNSIISGNVNYGTTTGLDFRAFGTAHAYNTLFTADGSALGGNGDYVNNDYAAHYGYGGSIMFGSPRLSALADNGGSTKTLRPRFGSPAIDAAQTSFTQPAAGQPLRFDQRGEPRVYGSYADLGAVELQSVLMAAQFTITVSAGANGSISPTGDQNVNELSDNTFTVTPDADHVISSVTVDGVLQTVSDNSTFSFTFDDVEQNHSISATFEPITHTITVTQGANGTITPSTRNVNQGSNETFTVTPDSGYQIASVTVDGVQQTVSDSSSFSYTFTNVNATGTIAATFEVDPSAPAPAPENNSGAGGSAGPVSSTTTVEAVASTLDAGQVIEIDANKEETVLLTGTDLDLIDSVMIGDTELRFEVSDSSEQITLTIPASVAGELRVEFFFGENKLEHSIMVKEVINPSVVNAGSFKGVVAIYAKNLEGKRLSAKVGKDWVVVDSLDSNFVRVIEPVGRVGYQLAVRIFIDRKLVKTVRLITK